MTLQIWLTFIAAVVVFCLIPGPTVILVVGQAISHGKKSVLPLIAGVVLGDFVAMSLSLMGLGAVLATSAGLFLVLKWFSVVYLFYLGVKTWRQNPTGNTLCLDKQNKNHQGAFKSAFVVTALNPKSIIFFIAFLPQFVVSESPAFPQLLILMFTFLSIVTLNIAFYATFSGRVRHKIQSYRARKRLNRISGSSLIGASIITSTIQRA